MRAQEPGTETPAPNTDLTPPLNPNSLMPLTLTGCCCQLLLLLRVRQLRRHQRTDKRQIAQGIDVATFFSTFALNK